MPEFLSARPSVAKANFEDVLPNDVFSGPDDPLRHRWHSVLERGTAADCLALIRQVIRRQDLSYQGELTKVTLPGVGLSYEQVDRHGFVVRGQPEDTFRVSVAPWKPSWLEGGTWEPARAAVSQEPRRSFEPAPGDPVLQAWEEHHGEAINTYLCEAQRDAVRATLEAPPGSTLLVVMPTGSGKSLCAHLPALLDTDSLSVVVVPTVALALDQERAIGLGDTAYRAGQSGNATVLCDRIRRREQRIVFASPEAVLTSLAPALRDAAASGYLRHFVVDEAHIVDAWGDEFRPAFQKLAGFRQTLLETSPVSFRTLLLSATVTPETQATLRRLFSTPGPYATYASVQLRSEPSYWFHRASSETVRITRVLEAVHHLPRPLILYVSKRGHAKDWYRRLCDAGYARVATVSGDTSSSQREEIIDQWRARELDIIVGTSAFGMGVDQKDVRSVVHACLPESIDRYYQEVGRAGRDGAASIALLCTAPQDESVAKKIARKRYITVDLGLRRWRQMFTSAEGQGGGTFSVSLLESYDSAMASRANILWNERTLLLMERAGFINVLGPPDMRENEGRDDEGAEKAWSYRTGEKQEGNEEKKVYRDQRQRIEILDYRHSDKAAWQECVEPARQEAMEYVDQSLQKMKALSQTKKCVSHLLASVYVVEEGRVARACGGCPACRAEGRSNRPQPLPLPPWPWGAPRLPEALEGLGPSPLYVFYVASSDRAVRRRRKRVLQALVRRGACHIVVPDPLGDYFDDVRSVRLYRSASYDPVDLPDLPTVHVVAPGDPVPEAIIYEGPPTWRVHLLPENARDPRDPLRLLRRMKDGITLADLARRLGV